MKQVAEMVELRESFRDGPADDGSILIGAKEGSTIGN